MTVELDHTIVCARDIAEAIRFYTDVVGFSYGGSTGGFEVIRVNEHLSFDLVAARPDRGGQACRCGARAG